MTPATALPTDGSSPRVRGTLPINTMALNKGRFIPACAGNARKRGRHYVYEPVHPRVCGERAGFNRAGQCGHGSSPRVRGTLLQRPQTVPERRFIPACAGNAVSPFGAPSNAAVHPRVCGERVATTKVAATPTGSSPRVRGTPRAAAPNP